MKQVELYRHNKSTYDNLVRIFETDNRCAVVQPTGSGKSFLIFKLAQDNSDKRIVVLEPNRYIISRVSEQSKEYGMTNIEFLTYQKLIRMTEDEISRISADYICLDELHRTGAKEWGRCVEVLFKKFPDTKFLGLTATPQRSDGVNILDDFNGEIACNISLGDAIVRRILPTPTYISALYTFDEEVDKISKQIDESRNSDEEKSEMRKELEAARHNLEKSMGIPNILTKHIPDRNGKYLVFCSNVEHLNTMRPLIKDWFSQAGFETHIYIVHTKYYNKNKEYKEFKIDTSDCIKLCLCVDMFNEGIHLEGITGVILFRPTQSNIIYFQQIGRALTASDENIPIIFDLVNNGNSLGAPSIRAEVENATEKQREESVNNENNNEVFNIDDFHIYDYVKNSLDILNEIENKCVDNWNFRIIQLKEFKEKYGHCCVTTKLAYNWKGLYEWCEGVRSSKQRYVDEKIQVLQNIGFVWDVPLWNFNILIKHCQNYIAENNNTNIPYRYICEDGYKLGRQLYYYKCNYKKGLLSLDQINQFKNIRINLDYVTFDETWMIHYKYAYEYINDLHKKIKYNTVYKGYKIGKWFNANIYKYKNGKLKDERAELFKPICDSNSRDFNKRWIDFLDLLKEYLSKFNCIYQNTEYKGFKIGSKLFNCRYQYKIKNFPEERYRQLLELGIDLAKEGSLM